MSKKILIVDDERDVEFLFNQKFRKELKEGILEFHFAFSGEQAIDYLHSASQTELVLVLSDINMPGMTGIELLRRIKSEIPAPAVFMITAYGDELNYNRAMELGADDFINKPVDFASLKEKIMKV